jgi:DNA-binding LacI/PurR family transcriptional regulator
VPRDVSIVGIDGLFSRALSNPMLTTVQLPVREHGAGDGRDRDRAAMPARPRRERAGVHRHPLVERESVAAAAGREAKR